MKQIYAKRKNVEEINTSLTEFNGKSLLALFNEGLEFRSNGADDYIPVYFDVAFRCKENILALKNTEDKKDQIKLSLSVLFGLEEKAEATITAEKYIDSISEFMMQEMNAMASPSRILKSIVGAYKGKDPKGEGDCIKIIHLFDMSKNEKDVSLVATQIPFGVVAIDEFKKETLFNALASGEEKILSVMKLNPVVEIPRWGKSEIGKYEAIGGVCMNIAQSVKDACMHSKSFEQVQGTLDEIAEDLGRIIGLINLLKSADEINIELMAVSGLEFEKTMADPVAFEKLYDSVSSHFGNQESDATQCRTEDPECPIPVEQI